MALLVTVYMDYIGGRDTELGPVGAAALLWLLLWMTVVLGVVALIRWLLEQWWERAFLTTKAFLVALVGTLVHMGFVEIYAPAHLGAGALLWLLLWMTVVLGVVALIRWLLEQRWERAFLTTKAFLVALLGTLVHMGFLGVYGFFSAEYKYLSHGERLALGLPFVFLVLLTGLLGVVAVIRWLLHAAFKR